MCGIASAFVAALAVGLADPFVGMSGDGHVTPAAAVPFGMVQAGLDTGIGKWEYTSGYQYGDATIIGFSQTHLNGTGCPDLGDVSLMPPMALRIIPTGTMCKPR